jgi:REP element-mobilizing transposase RayT
VVEAFNRSVIVFVTVCTKDRNPILACDQMHDWVRRAWAFADHWGVGRYVVMPDHIHLFCAPGVYPSTPVKKWAEYWKGMIARAAKGHGPLIESGAGVTAPSMPESPGGPASTPATSGAGGTAPSICPLNPGAGGTAPSNGADHLSGGPGSTPALPPTWPDPLWQQDCWDTQLRRGENYSEKWEYVRRNPVRAGLCASPEEWRFQGEIQTLMWHD